MEPSVSGRRIAVLASDGVGLVESVKALRAAGASITLVWLKAGEIQAMTG